MVFANDLFPKDWKSFFIGRDDEYLKPPSTTVKLGILTGSGDLNAIVTPILLPIRISKGNGCAIGEGRHQPKETRGARP